MCAICGVKSTKELKDDGYSEHQLRRAVAQRLESHQNLVRLRWGWYATQEADPEVVVAVTAGGVLTCVSALRFIGRRSAIELWTPPGSATHVRLAKGGRGSERGAGIVFCQGPGRPLPADHAVDPLPVALHGAARCVPRDFWIAMCDSVLHNTDWTLPDLQAAMGKVSPELLRMMRRCNALAESGTESIVRVRLEAAGYRVHVQPVLGGYRRADLRIGRLLIECDSETHHSGEARRRDLRRDRTTLGHGWLTMRIDYHDVLYRWDEVLADVAAFTATGRHRIRGRGDFPTPIE